VATEHRSVEYAFSVSWNVGGIRSFAEESYSDPSIAAGDGGIEGGFAFGIFGVKVAVLRGEERGYYEEVPTRGGDGKGGISLA
jgi:hypothetical protein